jgi:hypothetical protein
MGCRRLEGSAAQEPFCSIVYALERDPQECESLLDPDAFAIVLVEDALLDFRSACQPIKYFAHDCFKAESR